MQPELILFDLDNTLFMHNMFCWNRRYYEYKVKKYLNSLRENGTIIGLVTYNSDPYSMLENMGILSYFTYIKKPEIISKDFYNSTVQYQYEDIFYTTFYKDKSIVVYKKKSVMIKSILQDCNVKIENIVFYDDDPNHINDVRTLGIKSILVDPDIGIFKL